MSSLDQRVQDFVSRRGFKGLARRIFMLRIRWHVWRGQVVSARIVEEGEGR